MMNKIMGNNNPTQLANDPKPTNFGNNTYQYAVPGQIEVLNLDSIKIMEELKK